jgi:hypothetical protein
MTEVDWLACTEPHAMLEYLKGRASERKLGLFGVACCRRLGHLLTDAQSREAVDLAERFADGLATHAQLDVGMDAAFDVFHEVKLPFDEPWDPRAAYNPAADVASAVFHLRATGADGAEWVAAFASSGLAYLAGSYDDPAWDAARQAERARQCGLLRDLFGNPFRSIRLEPGWLRHDGGAVLQAARAIYEGSRFDELPQLGDLLERAGCSDDEILGHCRRPGDHIRGCWVVDLLLGKEEALRVGMATQADWLTCDDPRPLMEFLRGKVSERKLRLLIVACCRSMQLPMDGRNRQAVEVAERYADGLATPEEFAAARAGAVEAEEEANFAEWCAEAKANFCYSAEYRAAQTAHSGAWLARLAVATRDEMAEAAELAAGRREAAALVHDLFDGSFGPVGEKSCWLGWSDGTLRRCLVPAPRLTHADPAWLRWKDGLVVRLAQSIYKDRRFGDLPLLADMLTDAGCDNAHILDHCRSSGEHVLGCWVVDMILAKE